MAQIKGTDVSVGYEKRIVAGGINFEINEGDYLYIVGENGSGKTTLMNILSTLDEATEGEVYLGNEALSQMSIKEKEKIRR